MNWQKSFLAEGKKKEDEFARCLIASCGGTVEPASRSEDIDGHIDLTWFPPKGRKCTFDVKGARKNSRNDSDTSEDNTWVEIRSVKGWIGSLLGREDYVAFETEAQWLIARRQDLAEACISSIKENKIYTENPNENFLLYSRADRKDIIMRIPISLVEKISCRKIEKIYS